MGGGKQNDWKNKLDYTFILDRYKKEYKEFSRSHESKFSD